MFTAIYGIRLPSKKNIRYSPHLSPRPDRIRPGGLRRPTSRG